MKRLTLLLALLLEGAVHGQTTYQLTEKPSASKVADAKATMDAIKDAPVNMNIGGYVLIQIKVTTKLTVYPVPGSNDCLETETIPKGAVKKGWMIPEGSKEWVYVTIPADKDYDRLWVTGTVKGTATILWLAVVNNEPVVVAGYRFDVAGGKPKPPDPGPDIPPLNDFEKRLKSAADADIKAGKGSREHALLLASVYRAASNALPASTTVGELYKTLQTAFTTAGVPPPAQSLTTMRQLIAAELDKKLPTGADQPVTLEDRNRISAAFTMIADSLEAIFP